MRGTLTALLSLTLVTTALAGCIGTDPANGDDELSASAGTSVFTDTDVFEGDYDTEAFRLLERGPYEDVVQSVDLVTSELDGADIMIYVMRPDVPDAVKVPVIVDAGPYFPPMYDADLSESDLLVDIVSHGFAFSFLSVRGTGDSGGCMDLMGPAERHDIDQGITWLGTQPWSNGNVGMFGGSYDGSTQFQAMSTGNPHLKTVVPLAGIPDLHTFFVRNGSVMAWTPLQFGGIYWLFYGPAAYNPLNGRSAENTVEQFVCPESMEGLAASMYNTATGERDPFGYWEERDWRDEILENYEGSVYLIQGFNDVTVEPHNSYPLVNQLEQKGLVVKHTLGPWGHELPWRADTYEILLHWYDYWLNENTTVDLGPKVQVQDNALVWRSETSWPPEDAERHVLYLTGEGTLEAEPGSGGSVPVAMQVPLQHPMAMVERHNSFWKLWEDPMETVCPACPTFELGPVEEELRFAGHVRAHLSVTPTGPGGHITAILYSVDDAGEATRVGMGQMDLRFAEGDGQSRPVVPGQTITARMELQPTDAVVPAGGTLVLMVHQGSYGVRMPSPVGAPVMLELDDGASTLDLPVIVRGTEAFHEAPPRIGEGPPR